MEELIEIILMGIIQGIAEWLPISSSGHLVIFHKLLGMEESPLIITLFLHIGSLLAIIFFLRKHIYELIKGVIKLEKEWLLYLTYLIIAIIPIGIVGIIFRNEIEGLFQNPLNVGIALLITSAFLFLSRYPQKKNKKLDFKSGIIIGLTQILALFPGISRSGVTISTGFMSGIKRENAVRFSFLMFIPTILGAFILELTKLEPNTLSYHPFLGAFIAFIISLLSLNLLMYIIRKGHFDKFGWYCLILGLFLMIFVQYL